MNNIFLNLSKTVALGVFGLVFVSLSQISTASAACHPALRLAQGSHGWSQTTGHQYVTIKKIYDRVARDPWIYDLIGCPIANYGVSRDNGAFIPFENGAIYTQANAEAGAHFIMGAIYQKWRELGYEHGEMGYPVSDEFSPQQFDQKLVNVRLSGFQGGAIAWSSVAGAHPVTGSIWREWNGRGERLFPTTDVHVSNGSPCPMFTKQQQFSYILDQAFACIDPNDSNHVVWHEWSEVIPPVSCCVGGI